MTTNKFKVLEIFKLSKYGIVIILDQESTFSVGNNIKRISDGQVWTVKALEKWSHRVTTDAIVVDLDSTIVKGDEIVLV